jgi:predicted TIM-barrel fold metal-dependent hydrolase
MPNRFPDVLSTHVCAHPTEQLAALCSVVIGGVLERHPTLRVGFLESGIGWVPYALERLDEHHELLAGEVPHLSHPPSHYMLSGRCFFHADEDERALPYAISVLGDKCLMYASDYPHWDSHFPDGVRSLRQRTDLGEETKGRLLGDNALRFYGPRVSGTT